MTPFNERAEDMGLDISGAHKGLYSYEDRYSKIAYRSLGSVDIYTEDENQRHPSDGAGAAIKGSGDDLVDISRQTLTAVLPFSCPGAALTHAPDTERAFKICENSYMHMNISN